MGDRASNSFDLRKSLLVLFLPLIAAILTANYQYVITRWEKSDKNGRTVVSELSSKDKDKRHAVAASVGTYARIGDVILMKLSTF